MKSSAANCLVILSLCATPAVAADKAPFTGFALGATAGVSHNSIDYSGYLDGHSSSKNDFAGGLAASYGFALGDKATLSLGATYVLNKTEFGTTTYQEDGDTVRVDGKLKNHWSIFVAPGYRFAPQWLGYAKLAYHQATSDYTDTLMGSGESHHHGVGYGAGLAYAVASNVEISAEVEHVDLNRKYFALSSGEPAITEFKLGVNYRF